MGVGRAGSSPRLRCGVPRDAESRIAIRPLVEPTVARTIGLIRRRDAALSAGARDFQLALCRMAPLDPALIQPD